MADTAENMEQQEPYGNELIELTRVDQALAELRAKHGNVPDYTTAEGYKAGKASIKELTGYRTGTDKARLAITKPHREFIERVNSYGKSLIAEIEKLEQPHRDAKQIVDEAEQRKKEERIARLRQRIAREITSYLDTAQGLDSSALAELYDQAQGIDTGDYFDVTQEAEDERARVINEISAMHDAAVQREQLAAEQARIDAEKRRMREEEAKREAERAELEELRRFKAEQEAQAAQPESASMVVAPSGPEIYQDEPHSVGADFADEEDWEATAVTGSESNWDAARSDLIDAGLDWQSAEAVVQAIFDGAIRHVAFDSGE
ncbi:hypothetical protein P3W43_01295 [Salinicola salarius]|uniref:hypothetical protein n=1 Tax=Salinicola salarius TaxID=430457 RepID=UPI0023E3CF67|nr:hypothetical protein [Salinicola salarius]MDF3917484.1 hypothetical protein [Salinicola salarius]